MTNLRRRFLRRWAAWKYAPAIEVQYPADLLRLGSECGGWTFQPSSDLRGSVIVSCGLGEDASFDIEFASKFQAKVIVVDPTPRAIRHFEDIQGRLGQPPLQGYTDGGKQPIESYDLRNVAKGSLILEPSALWVDENTRSYFKTLRNTIMKQAI